MECTVFSSASSQRGPRKSEIKSIQGTVQRHGVGAGTCWRLGGAAKEVENAAQRAPDLQPRFGLTFSQGPSELNVSVVPLIGSPLTLLKLRLLHAVLSLPSPSKPPNVDEHTSPPGFFPSVFCVDFNSVSVTYISSTLTFMICFKIITLSPLVI